jgi:hypothetical protein
VVKRTGFLLVELLFFISAISFFLISFFYFQFHGLKVTGKIEQQTNRLAEIKDDYYFAMTATLPQVMLNNKYIAEEMDEEYYKIIVISDNIFENLFVIRKK